MDGLFAWGHIWQTQRLLPTLCSGTVVYGANSAAFQASLSPAYLSADSDSLGASSLIEFKTPMEPDRSPGKEDSGRQGQGRGFVLGHPPPSSQLYVCLHAGSRGQPGQGT